MGNKIGKKLKNIVNFSPTDKPGTVETMTNVIMFVDNKSTVVVNGDVQLMIEACNQLMPAVATAWNVSCPIVKFGTAVDKQANVQTNWLFHIVDVDPNGVEGALAYHTVENDLVDGYILAKTIIDNSGVVLYGGATNPNQETIASALFHELVEALGDPECNSWWSNTTGQITDQYGNPLVDQNGNAITNANFCAAELCDPVQGNVVPVTINYKGKVLTIGLSDFVLPAWSENNNTTGPYNYLRTLSAPFTLAPGSYVVYEDAINGTQAQAFANLTPEWVKIMKINSNRVNKRKNYKNKNDDDNSDSDNTKYTTFDGED